MSLEFADRSTVPDVLAGPLTTSPEAQALASRYVASRARDAEDARCLMEALGLAVAPAVARPPRKRRRKVAAPELAGF